VVEPTPLKNMLKLDRFPPQIGVKVPKIFENHHRVIIHIALEKVISMFNEGIILTFKTSTFNRHQSTIISITMI